ncbi:PAS domain S-box protein [Cytophaga hutchinsonii]|nr:PAS domain S-box protein [Cytophaga hutchinsonii]
MSNDSTPMPHPSEYDEAARLNALQKYLIENNEGQEKFKDLTYIAASVCNTEHAFITLLNKDNLVFLSSFKPPLAEITRDLSFCEITIQSDTVHEVQDARVHERFSNNPYVIGEPYLRYYCGAPLIDENGYKLGALCVLDTNPRTLTENQKKSLVLLAKQVMNDFRINSREKELEQKHAELEEIIRQRTASLIDTNHWLSRIIDLVPHPIFLKDHNGKYLLANIAQGELFGKKPEELLGKTDIDFVYNSDEYVVIKQSDDKVVSTRKTVVLPEQIVTLGDIKYYLYTSKVPLISPVDGELRILGVSINLTEVRALQLEYDQSMEAYQKLVEISPDAIYIQSMEGEILFANPSGIKLLGATDLNELVGLSVMNFIHPDYLNVVENRIGDAENLSGNISEQKAVTLKGEILDIEVVSVAFSYNGKAAEQVIVRNVTDKIKARHALYQSREEFRTLTDNSTDIITRITTDLHFIYINKAITKLTGKPLDFYSGKSPKEAGFDEDLCKGIEYMVQKTVATHKLSSLYFENPKLKGAFRYAHAICVPEFDEHNAVTSVLCTVQDVTELKENEQMLIQTSKDLDRFVYSASHELRAPLKSILGLTHLVLHDVQTDNYQDIPEYISRIERSVHRLDETVKDIIEYSRNNRLEVKRELISFEKIVTDVKENLSSLANYSRIAFSIKIDTGLPFYSDSRRIKIIMNNIVSNSIKYADLTKSNPQVELIIQTVETGCSIVIRDNGIGIDAAYIDHIYDMFYRATSSNEGDGLGLYIVKETLTKLEGAIYTASILKEGTEFKIQLPNL